MSIKERPMHVPMLPPNGAMKNFTAMELNRFIDKRLTDVAKSRVGPANRRYKTTADDIVKIAADDKKGKRLRADLFGKFPKKEMISNQTIMTIEQPFADFSMTRQSLKQEKHAAFLIKQEEKQMKVKQQIAEMSRKLEIYRRYKDQFNITLTKKERDKLMKNEDS